jgi:CheY-like chemotaxis protein
MNDASLTGIRVLFLEDEALINMMTAAILEEMGCTVTACMHLDQCFDAIAREWPDVAVLDININGTMSYALADRLQERGVPVVFLTGYEELPLKRGGRAYLRCRKPCVVDELRDCLIEAVNSRRPVSAPARR